MRFVVLGSGTGLPQVGHGPAGFLVQVGDHAWLVDGGSGTLQRCVAAGIDPVTLDGGFYSHHHPDHCADLVPLLFAMRIARRDRDYPIVAGRGLGRVLAGLQQTWGDWIAPGTGTVRLDELPLDRTSERVQHGLTVRAAPAVHGAGALHLRFEADGGAVVFSGDTGPSPALVELARGADLLVCECASSRERPIGGHLTAEEVAAVVDAARPRAVWLTHFYPGADVAHALAVVAEVGVPVTRPGDGDAYSHSMVAGGLDETS